jgi:hypothetical protein
MPSASLLSTKSKGDLNAKEAKGQTLESAKILCVLCERTSRPLRLNPSSLHHSPLDA